MTRLYWQAKSWGLLHDPGYKGLSHSQDFGREGQWHILKSMSGWKSPKEKCKYESLDAIASESLNGTWLKHIGLSDLIASASDRSTIGRLDPTYSAISYRDHGLQIHHLLSGKAQSIKISQWHERLQQPKRKDFLEAQELAVLNLIKEEEDPRLVHWWLWRCYPDILAKDMSEIYLLPAETRFPDASLWSHTSITSALAGGLAGYYQQREDYPSKNQSFTRSRPHLVIFTFSPVQELVKSSRKMRDFWAGSFLLHYLSAKICYKLAHRYGADIFLYPCLYQQPLIDHWLLDDYPQFSQWIEKPTPQQLLTAGFPNNIVMILPDNGKQGEEIKDNPIYAATQYAKQILKQEWEKLGNKSLENLIKINPAWENINPHTWDGWLNAQWQTYWTALPIGNIETDLHHSYGKSKDKTKERENQQKYQAWCRQQNDFTGLEEDPENPEKSPTLFHQHEAEFLKAIFGIADMETEIGSNSQSYSKQPNLNVGSWWGNIFDRLRNNLRAVKNARNWKIPTAFTTRSTISGIGAVVHNYNLDWVKEGETKQFWQNKRHIGLFDGVEQLNATEVVKRVLHRILPEILAGNNNQIKDFSLTYPDLSSGVAGWLKQAQSQGDKQAIELYQRSCAEITQQYNWTEAVARTAWGIPWINYNYPQLPNPRLLNYGWLIEDAGIDQTVAAKQKQLEELKNTITKYFPAGRNPTDWYVIAAGDGDDMGKWLKGSKLKSYQNYIPQELINKINNSPDTIKTPVTQFLQVNKRMGPATHSALSRSLLDFANQLVPYLTESRYAGRLIYCGGDDILAYSNLWEWDQWLWDIRQCFRGQDDPKQEFISQGDYWRLGDKHLNKNSATDGLCLPDRPLFTLGSSATISFGVVIAHHSVPLAIALENLWQAEAEAKEHYYLDDIGIIYKDAVQVRAVYGNGNILQATAKFNVFDAWRELVEFAQQHDQLDSAIFEQAVEIWLQHPAPPTAIEQWTKGFCERRNVFSNNIEDREIFAFKLSKLIKDLIKHNYNHQKSDEEIRNWLKLAAFTIRNRAISVSNLVTQH